MLKPLLSLILLASAGSATAARPVEAQCTVAPGARVAIKNPAGSVEILGWEKNELRLTGHLGDKAGELRVECGQGKDIRIEVEKQGRGDEVDRAHLRIQLPVAATLDVNTVSADITVTGARGAVEISTVSGDLNLEVGSERVAARTVSGNISLQGQSAQTALNTVSGDIHVRGVRGEMRIESVSGDLSAQAQALLQGTLKTVSGDITLRGSVTDAAELEVETLSGRVEVELPKNTAAMLALHTFSGALRSEFEGGKRGERRIEQTLGKGGARISIHSFSGDIRVRRE